ncbi:MAG: DUF3822 family protein [Flavobacterium sp.]|nr:DUF3822 family protein [Flavobacterium sp.]
MTNITAKNYRKLVIRLSLNGFSYCIFDTLENKPLRIDSVDFSSLPKSARVEELYVQAFQDIKEFSETYDNVIALHDNSLNTFVPQALFDEEYMGSYLQYNTKVFETDFFAFDELTNYEINHIYIPYVNINNLLIDQFGSFDYRHSNTVLVSRLLDKSKNIDDKQVFVHFDTACFQVVVAQNQKLLLFNSFDFSTKEDFIYYLLFKAEQLHLNPETVKVILSGRISEESELYQIAYKYVRHVSLHDISDLKSQTGLTETECRQHFIILQA